MTAVSDFTAMLREVAAAYDEIPELPLPNWLRFYAPGTGPEQRAAFGAVRHAFPAAEVDVSDDYYVRVTIGAIVFCFSKACLGEKRTVTREVEEYVLDPALLCAVPS